MTKKFRPKHREEYFYINENQDICSHVYCPEKYFDDYIRIYFGNCFKNRKETYLILIKIKAPAQYKESVNIMREDRGWKKIK